MIILLSGKQGSGKTTIANALELALSSRAKYPVIVYQMRFAQAIYEMHDKCLEVLRRYNIVPKSNKDGNLLQVLGTEWGRKTYGDDVWIGALRNHIDQKIQIHSVKSFYIISDCRFRNEFDAFPEALRVRLTCNRDARKERCASWRDNDHHISETDLDGYDQSNKFDLCLDTFGDNVNHCVEMIMAQLDKNTWLEKRKINQELGAL